MIVRTPQTAASGKGIVNDSLVENFDIGPTLVELAGGTIDYRQFARSLCRSMASADIEHRPDGISEFRGEFMITNREGKSCLLFNLENDPRETRNLAGLPE